MKIITVLTTTRAEYGLLSPIIHALKECGEFEVRVVVTGAHLSPEFGLTYKEIEEDGIEIDQKIEILLSSDTPASISKSMGLAMISFADYFEARRPDALVVLGDRYETLAVCCVAMNAQIPIIHLYGGETTEGAIDEAVRHSITKLSYLHLTSTDEYRRRVIQLGEDPDRVFTVGSVGTENILKTKLLSKKELEESIGMALDQPYAVVTFHPVTLENNSAEEQFSQILQALESIPNMKFIFTKANADSGGRVINRMINEYVSKHDHAVAFDSLGKVRYLSALKYAEMVIGNSSSGLIEAPTFGIPTVNIGERQKGRVKAESVIDCLPEKESIITTIMAARDQAFREKCANTENPYGDGDTTEKVVEAVCRMMNGSSDLKKKFYDIEVLE